MKQFFPFFALLTVLCCFACQQGSKNDARNAPISMSQKPVAETSDDINPDASSNSFEALVQDFEDQDRVIWQKPDAVIGMLGDLKGKKVADIGAGTGYFAFRLVPEAEKVIAIDIEPMMIAFMDSVRHRLSEEAASRFDTRLAKPNDPLLQPQEVDAVIIVNTYGYLDDRVKYLKVVHQGLDVGGRLLIIDFKKNHLPIGPDAAYKVSAAQVGKELAEAGYKLLKTDNSTLDYQYLILAEKITKE